MDQVFKILEMVADECQFDHVLILPLPPPSTHFSVSKFSISVKTNIYANPFFENAK